MLDIFSVIIYFRAWESGFRIVSSFAEKKSNFRLPYEFWTTFPRNCLTILLFKTCQFFPLMGWSEKKQEIRERVRFRSSFNADRTVFRSTWCLRATDGRTFIFHQPFFFFLIIIFFLSPENFSIRFSWSSISRIFECNNLCLGWRTTPFARLRTF